MNVSAGKTIDTMADDLMADKLTTNFYNAKRLCRQEVAKYYREITQERYNDMGIKKVKWHCVDDDRTCEECRKHNNEIMPISKSPVNGWHIQCRC